MSLQSLDPFFRPKRVVLIGATARPNSVGSVLARNLAAFGQDRVAFVNPFVSEIDGVAVHPSVADLAAPADLAVVAVPPEAIVGVMAEIGAAGIHHAVVITTGLGHGSGSLLEAMTAVARDKGIRVLGPNSAGLQIPPIGLNASFAQRAAVPGDLAFVSQSGTLTHAALDWAARHGIGFSGIAVLGDAVDVDFDEMLDHFALDHRTRAILLYLESIRDARAFLSAARAAARSKPVVVIKAGRHAAGARAARSHTGALAGVDAVYDCAFRRAGLLRVADLDEMFAAAETLSLVPRIQGKRIAVITNGGGAGVLAADRVVDLGGELATLGDDTIAALDEVLPLGWSRGNPVDLIGNAAADRYGAATRAVLADSGVDAVVAINCPTPLAPSRLAAEAVVEAVADYRRGRYDGKPLIAAWLGEDDGWNTTFARARIPALETPHGAVEGLMQLVRHAEAQAALTATPADVLAEFSPDRARAAAVIAAALADNRLWLKASEVVELLTTYGIPIVPALAAADPGEAKRLAALLLAEHRSLVVKIASPDIVHKSDVGGVELELSTPEAVGAATDDVIARAKAARPGARIDGVTLHPMIVAPKAVELIAGVTDDPIFGPVMVFGRGGTAVEVINDRALALPPLDANLARDLIARTRVARQLQGYRDRRPVDVDRLAIILQRLAQLVAEHPAIADIDLNPLIAEADRLTVVDARVTLVADSPASGGAVHHPRLSIRPYPTEWEEFIALPNGRSVFVRPVRPEDEGRYLTFFSKMTAEDMRLRFFQRVHDLGHAFVARLTQIDYSRAMAFVALDPESSEMLGGVRLHGDPGGGDGEYAVSVRSDLKGVGLGRALMLQIIRYARRERYGRIHGEVLAENRQMLRMCERLGFKLTPDPDSPEIIKVALDLRSTAD